MRRRGAALVLAAALTFAGACIELTVDDSKIGSLEFVPYAYPSIDAGDTLRDATGAVSPLQARVYRADGTLDDKVPVTWVVFDSGAKIVDGRLVANALAANATSMTVNVLASAGGIQSLRRSIKVVHPPTGFASTTTGQRLTVRYALIPTPTSDTFPELSTKVTRSNATIGVPGYVVTWTLRSGNQVLPATDTTASFFLLDGSNRVSAVDTTDDTGAASRKLIFRKRDGRPSTDSVEVLARVRRGRSITTTDSLRWVVTFQPR